MSNSLFSPNIHGFLVDNFDVSHISIDANCTYGIQWIWVAFRQCAVTPREITAVIMGMISTTIWLVFAFPQIWVNFRRGIPDQAISPLLLGSFFIGDIFNLSGCFLTHQLVLQTIIAINGVACDIIQIIQFIYYKMRHRHLFQDAIQVSEDNNNERVVDSSSPSLRSSSPLLCFVGLFCLSSSFLCFTSYSVSKPTSPAVSSIVMRTLLYVSSSNVSTLPPTPIKPPFFPTPTAYVGYVLGWCSAITFGFSRIPQILKNWRRKCTEGVSVVSFSLAVVGNVTYGLQIFLTSCDTLYLLRSLPWIVGFPGVIILDSVICFQFYFYHKKAYTPLVNSSDEGEDQSVSHTSSISV